MSTSKKSHKLTTFGLAWYFITAALMLILLIGHFALLFDAAGLLRLLRLKFWMTGIYVYAPAWIVLGVILYAASRYFGKNRPVPELSILLMIALPVILSVIRLIGKLCGAAYFLDIRVSWVYAIIQTAALVFYIVSLFRFVGARKTEEM